MREHRAELRSDNATHLSTFTTGGSTGEPLIFDLGKLRVASRVACRQRVAHWWGVGIGDPEIAVWGSPIELSRQDRIRRLRDWLLSTTLLSAYEMNDATMSTYVDILASGRYRHIFAYPSSLYALCAHARRQGKDLRKAGVTVAFVTSEVLLDYQRSVISETLGCPVANGYGGRDSGFISHECPQGGMHTMADAILVEILDDDGNRLPDGELGQIVVTDLYSQEAPFLRYVTGDMGVSSSRRCPCGRPLPVLAHIEGRANDCVVTSDGRVMHGQSLISRLMEIEGIEQFRIRQTRVDGFHLQLVCSERYQRTVAEERIRNGWNQVLRVSAVVTFEYLSRIPAEPRGKFRHIVCDVPIDSRGLASVPTTS